MNSAPYVDWAHFGTRPLDEPFFEDSIRRTLRHPFNRFFRIRMSLRDFVATAAKEECLAPRGFIFHMSRCGSTLAGRMLAALSHSSVISEAQPIDAMLQFARLRPGDADGRHGQALATMVTALIRRRDGGESRAFIKLDSWHVLALPLIRRTFPAVPWVFLYRDPVEVLVSQMRQRGTQMVPEMLPPSVYGLHGIENSPDAGYCARVLRTICTAAADHIGPGNGLLVNYRELPEAMLSRVLPHFGVSANESERAAMRRAARFDAKSPGFEFSSDSAAKQNEATAEIRALAERHIGDVYRRLEALRRASP